MKKLGLDTNLLSLRDMFYILGIAAAAITAYTQLATEAQLGTAKNDLQQQIDVQKDLNQKLDTSIQLLNQSADNNDKSMEAFTRALEQIREGQ